MDDDGTIRLQKSTVVVLTLLISGAGVVGGMVVSWSNERTKLALLTSEQDHIRASIQSLNSAIDGLNQRLSSHVEDKAEHLAALERRMFILEERFNSHMTNLHRAPPFDVGGSDPQRGGRR